MTPPRDEAARLALALDAFMSEHRRCWRLYGVGLESKENAFAISVECGGCSAALIIPWAVP